MQIEDGRVATFHYTLTDDDGTVIDSSSGGQPMAYLHGAENIVPGLERQLTGLETGAKLVADVTPEEGYGAHNGVEPQAVPRSEFPRDADLRVGMGFRAQGGDGKEMVLFVSDIRGSRVFVDTNHPLAGKTLHFDVEIVDVRESSEVERAHGHPHGPGGHHH